MEKAGKIVARVVVDRAVWKKLKAEAVLEGVSVSEFVGKLLADYTTHQNGAMRHVSRT